MVRFNLPTALLAAATLVRAIDPVSEHPAEAPVTVPGAYIIEYEDDATVNAHSLVASIDDGTTVRRELRSQIFRGASIQVKDIEKAEKVAATVAANPRIKNVWRVKEVPAPRYTVHSRGTGIDGVEGAALLKRQGNDTVFTPHILTQVDKLRNAGITGKGIKVAVIDTGIDYLHPALGGCFGPGCLVSFGTDLVGDNFTGKNKPVPDADPLDNCNGHGTHVAGIIAAQSNNPYGIIGAAQGVELGAYRVFGCSGNVENDILIDAYLQAYEAGADLITASVGGPSGWSEDAWSVVVSRIVERGVPCLLAAGNDGSVGPWYASTAANGVGATAIGSVDNSILPALLADGNYTVDGGAVEHFGFTPGDIASWATVTLPLWSVNFNANDPANGCEAYPDSTPDLSNYIVLIRRGTCTFVEKLTNAAKKGARYVVFYNNVAGTLSISGRVQGIQGVATVTADQGAAWIKQLAAGSKVSVTLPNPDTAPKALIEFANVDSPGTMSNYSSWGPTFELELKPQFSAPGGNILSTLPRALGAYGVLSGTSMATPLAAAVYALLMQARGTKNPKELEYVLSATAKPIKWKAGGLYADKNYLAPVPQQGGGLIQAWDAAHATTLLSASSLSFNDTDHFIPSREFAISNTGSKDITYSLGYTGAATAYSFAGTSTVPSVLTAVGLTGTYASLSFSASTFTIKAGQRKIITVKATPPSGLEAKRLPIYGGYITISGSDNSSLSLPYIGVAGSLKTTTVLASNAAWISRSTLNEQSYPPVALNTTFTLPPAGHANDTAYKDRTPLPAIVLNLAFGSRLIRAEVVPASNCSRAAANATVVLGTKTIGQVEEFPSLWNPRNPTGDQGVVEWTGALDDGTYAPAGKYKIVLKALRVFGNPALESDYDVAETQEFRIAYAALRSKAKRTVMIRGREVNL